MRADFKRGKSLITLFISGFLTISLLVQPFGAAWAQESNDAAVGKHHKLKHTHGKSHKRHLSQAMIMRPQPASYIIDADTNKVLQSENADSLRYPASLTKMMTLYLTFDALKKGKMKLDQTIPVSAHAASQPQTNIALQPGDRIAVKDAILSIVIRSANDSAVTLGEALGGTESAFAEKMTQKAHALGMKNTVFYNASGLPEPAQHTTAHDMAVLGLALRHDFPQYFPFFKTESFSYNGLTYITHNHVMTRYDGVDGIKTGYIRASGFNLVTSVTRNGHHLVAVVLGGPTWKARDDKMIALLDKTFAMYSTADKNIRFASAEKSKAFLPTAKAPYNDEAMEGEGDTKGEEIKTDAANAKSAQLASAAEDLSWAIQVGTFPRSTEAAAAATRAMKSAPDELKASQILPDESVNAVHRARLANLSQDQAENACHKLAALHQPCFAYKEE